jgi:rRNA maturation endonuclease Nob1
MNYTHIEIMHYTLLWCLNFSEEDWHDAFKTSDLPEGYFWNKFHSKVKAEMNSTQAAVEVVLNMDNKNQKLLIDFILKKYDLQIRKSREWNYTIDVTDNVLEDSLCPVCGYDFKDVSGTSGLMLCPGCGKSNVDISVLYDASKKYRFLY